MLHVSCQRSRVAAMPPLPPGAGGRAWGRGAAPTLPSSSVRWGEGLTAAVYLGFGTFLLYLVLFDQGQVSDVVLGSVLGHQNVLHEFFHDGRHLANAPCH
jgi:Probable cobalt transporter subunit (CbtB)